MKSYIRVKVHNKIRPILIKNKCEICGEVEKLELHHVKPFSELLEECHKDLDINKKKYKSDYTDTEIENIVNWMLGIHLKTNCLTLCDKCHSKYHKEFGGFVACGNGYADWLKQKRMIGEIKNKKRVKEVLMPYLDSIVDLWIFVIYLYYL